MKKKIGIVFGFLLGAIAIGTILLLIPYPKDTFLEKIQKSALSELKGATKVYQMFTSDSLQEPKVKVEHVTSETPLTELVGLEKNTLLSVYGQPVRKEKAAYGYEWYVYNREGSFLRFAIKDDKVVSIMVMGDKQNVKPFRMGQTYEELNNTYHFEKTVEFKYKDSQYQLLLKEKEKNYPLVRIDNTWVKLYFDEVTKKLIAIRYMDSETLIKSLSYDYRSMNDNVASETLTEKEQNEVNKMNELQIFEASNFIRNMYGKKVVVHEPKLDVVGYDHVKDMNDHDFFSHTSPLKGDFGRRLDDHKFLYYARTAENISMGYMDGIDATIGWLNSLSHREALLEGSYTHMGMAAYNRYYAEYFVTYH